MRPSKGLIAMRRKFAEFVASQHATPLSYEMRIVIALDGERRHAPSAADMGFERAVAERMAAAPPSTPSEIRELIVNLLRDTGYCLCRVACGCDCSECFAFEGLVEILSRVSVSAGKDSEQ